METTDRHRFDVPLADNVVITFRRIPACPDGFLMGSRGYRASEEPVHRVTIGDTFWMAETPTTQAQFDVWTKAKGVEHKNKFGGHHDHPAENMSWRQANEFCHWLNEECSHRFPEDCRVATLPPECLWEYACRVDTTTRFYSFQ